MDDSTKLTGPDSENPMGATGVFGQVKDSDTGKAGSPSAMGAFHVPGGQAPGRPAPAFAPNELAEPVVHKVALGGPPADKPPAPATVDQPAYGASSGGFTQLLRTLGNDSPVPAAPTLDRPMPMPPAQRPAPQESGFTSLLRTLGTDTPPAEPLKRASTDPVFQPEPPRAAPPSSSGGFTELLRTTPDSGFGAGPSQMPPRFADAPAPSAPKPEPPPQPQSSPGEFTRLFATLGSEGGASSAPAPSAQGAESQGSSTSAFSIPARPYAPEPSFAESSRPANNFDFGRAPGTFPAEPPRSGSRESFSPPLTPEPPAQTGTPGSGGAGLTQLIRMLDEPGTPHQPPNYGRGTGLVTPSGSMTGQYAASAPQSGVSAPSPASPPNITPVGGSGQSEYSRIIDASRMRELGMKSGQPSAGGNYAKPPEPPPATPPPQAPVMPNYPFPGMAMPGMGGMTPQYTPPVMQPPHISGPPMAYGAPGGAMPSQGGMPPMQPAMYSPPPIPTAPPPPPAPAPTPAQPGVGKMQQLIPLFLVLIIVLLLVVLVTVIFMLKR